MLNFEKASKKIDALSPDELAELLKEAMTESGLEHMIKEGEPNVFAPLNEDCPVDYMVIRPESMFF